MEGLTFDTGALLGIERRRARISRIYRMATAARTRITVPTAVVVEWWRARSDFAEDLLASVDVEPLDLDLARIAGEAVDSVRGASAVDAIVMASAARRGDIVYTSDLDDLERLRAHFPSVRVLAC